MTYNKDSGNHNPGVGGSSPSSATKKPNKNNDLGNLVKNQIDIDTH